jgi:hypothetical protein
MAVKLNVQANVTGQRQLTKLNAGLKSLGTQALIAKRKLAALQAGAARAKATMAGLGTALKVGVVAGFAAAGFAAASFVRGTITAGNLVEKSRIQFNAFFGDVQKGGQAFQVLTKYAGQVPFSLDKIIEGGTALAAISSGPKELGKNLQLVGNLAATANISFKDAALQYQRVASAGVAAADLLRDKGVSGLLGFTAGAKYSVDESVKIFEGAFLKGGRFSKVANQLADTLTGNVSMVEDFYFGIKAAAAEPLFEGLSAQVKELVGDFKENDAQLKAMGVRIGESLAKGFRNLGDFIKVVIDNFDLLVKAIKIFVAIKVVGFIGNIGMAMKLMASTVTATTFTFNALSIAIRANPIGFLVTVLQAAVFAWIAFSDEIKAVGKYISEKFTDIVDSATLKIRKFTQAIGLGSDDNIKEIEKIEDKIRTLAGRWDEASEAKFAYLKGSRFDDHTQKLENRKNYQGANPRGDMRSSEIAIADAHAKEMQSLNERIMYSEKLGIQMNSKEAGIAHQAKLDQVKEYRAQLSLIGIDSKAIGGIIGDTWLEGIRQGNTLLDTTKNAFKNVLVSISDTIVKRTAEVLVEKIFNSLLDQRIMKQKALNSATSEQGNIMSTLISKGASLFSSMGGGGGGSSLGSLFSMGRSFLGFNKGGVVPGGAPYTDRVPAMLTPGEVVVPRSKVDSQSGSTNITNINISGNVDQRSIDQIKSVISSASAEVGGANKAYTKNTQGVRGRNI